MISKSSARMRTPRQGSMVAEATALRRESPQADSFSYIRKVLTENELCKPITLLKQDIENRR